MTEIQNTGSMSYLTRCMIVCGLLVLPLTGANQTVYQSQACYGSARTCVRHSLKCQQGIIAIFEAYYTDNVECDIRGLSACPLNFSNIEAADRISDLQRPELYYLYGNCSSKQSCNFPATRNIGRTFSVVKYQCIKHTFNMCNATHTQLMDVSILWEGRHEFSGSCKCELSTKQNRESEFNISALEFRIKKTQLPCSEIMINSNADVLNCVSLISPFRNLNSTLPSGNLDVTLNIRESSSSDRIWIRIKSRRYFSLRCQHVPNTSTVPGVIPTMQSSSTSNNMAEATHYTNITQVTGDVNGMSSTLSPTEPQLSTGSSTLSIGPSFSTGALVGSLVACALIIAGVAFVTVLYLRKRKRQKTKKGGNTIPQTVPKETFSFANGIQENLYFEVEKLPPEPEAVQYDYATADGLRIHNKDVNGEGDYDHTGDKQSPLSGDYDTAASVASKVGHTKKGNIRVQDGDVYSYDHLNGATDSAKGDAAYYDTTVSSKKAVSKLNSKSNNVQEDDYSYNRLGSNHQVKTIQNEYDTTASAVKAVARLDETGAAEENDYDHVNGNNGYNTPASPYDSAGNVRDQRDDYNLAGKVTDPYDLAK